MAATNNPKSDAQEALDLAQNMSQAASLRAIAPRWFTVGLAFILWIGYSLYAIEGIGNYPAILMAIAMVIFIWFARAKTGVFGGSLPETRTPLWVLAVFGIFLLALFFGGVFVRRTYDLAWVPIATGLVSGLLLIVLSEFERHHQLSKMNDATRS